MYFLIKNMKKVKGLVHVFSDQKVEKSKGVSPCVSDQKIKKLKEVKGLVHVFSDQKIERSKGVSPWNFLSKS